MAVCKAINTSSEGEALKGSLGQGKKIKSGVSKLKHGKTLAVTAKPNPPLGLLFAIGAFLSEYGFHRTNNVFARELKEYTGIGGNVGFENAPSLIDLFESWEARQLTSMSTMTTTKKLRKNCSVPKPFDSNDNDSSTSSDSDPSSSESSDPSTSMSGSGGSGTSSFDPSDSDSWAEAEDSNASNNRHERKRKKTTLPLQSKSRKRKLEDSSSNNSDSDNRPPTAKRTKQSSKVGKSASSKWSIRSVSSISCSDSESSSASDSTQSSKKSSVHTSKGSNHAPLPKSKNSDDGGSSNSLSSSSSSSGSSDVGEEMNALSKRTRNHSTDSSTTLLGSTPSNSTCPENTDLSSKLLVGSKKEGEKMGRISSGCAKNTFRRATPSNTHSTPVLTPSESNPPRKHTGAKPTPLALASELPQSHPSNAYIPYAYAERAHKDLSVTRGKGFTKEKNKKKRGSYRGGPIDIGPGKSFKFED